MDYNVIVVGAGSGGLVSAYIAAVLKAKVALIEKHKMGGDCLNTGCVPSKALIRTASVLSQIKRHKDFGLSNATVEFDFAEVMERVQNVVRKVAPHDSVERYTSLGVDCFQGEAKILSPNKVAVDGKTYTTRNIIIATGGRPVTPPIPGIERIKILTTDNIWELRSQPKRLVIIGGGPIGSEIGQCFARLGSRVTIVQRAPHLLPREDDEIIKILEKRFVEEGMDLRLNTAAESIELSQDKKLLKVKSGNEVNAIEFDEILVAAGRAANVKGFGLEELGVKVSDRGTLAIDDYSRTSIPNIFACGDVAGPYQFTHAAAHQAWYCTVNALFQPLKKFKLDWSALPWCTYTDPEIARIGLNERDALSAGIKYEVTRYAIDDLDRAIADSEDHGVIKVLTRPGSDHILGVTICGYHAGDMLPEFVFARKHGHGLNSILNTIHAYPTMSEANKYAAGVWKKAHAPKGLLKWIAMFHGWRRGN